MNRIGAFRHFVFLAAFALLSQAPSSPVTGIDVSSSDFALQWPKDSTGLDLRQIINGIAETDHSATIALLGYLTKRGETKVLDRTRKDTQREVKTCKTQSPEEPDCPAGRAAFELERKVERATSECRSKRHRPSCLFLAAQIIASEAFQDHGDKLRRSANLSCASKNDTRCSAAIDRNGEFTLTLQRMVRFAGLRVHPKPGDAKITRQQNDLYQQLMSGLPAASEDE